MGAAVASGVGLALIVGRDGSPGWQLLRVTLVGVVTVSALAALGRLSRRGRAALEFIAGVLLVPIGFGIAIPHLNKVGLEPITLAGMLVLAGGLTLLISGSVTLVRLTRSWWRRLPAAAALLLVASVLTWAIGPAVAATNVPRAELGTAVPGDHGLEYQDVEFTTPDGVTLSGWYVPSANRAAVVLLHGAGSTRTAVLQHAAVLARHGYGVLLFDARGHGRSGGQAMDFGWYGDEDVTGAVSFLLQQPDVDPERIGAVGMSMGGEEAIGAAASDERIAAVIAEGATNRVAADKAWLSDEYGWRGTLQEGVEWLTYTTADLLTDADQPNTLRDAVRATAPRTRAAHRSGRTNRRRQCGTRRAERRPRQRGTVDRARRRPHRSDRDGARRVGGPSQRVPRGRTRGPNADSR